MAAGEESNERIPTYIDIHSQSQGSVHRWPWYSAERRANWQAGFEPAAAPCLRGFEPHSVMNRHYLILLLPSVTNSDKGSFAFPVLDVGMSGYLAVRVSHLNQIHWIPSYNTAHRPDDSCGVYPIFYLSSGTIFKGGLRTSG